MISRLQLAHRVLRSEPYRLFFPLAALVGILGVGHWIWYWQGWLSGYHGQAHAVTQSQSFLMAFVVGFLFTMIPRRLGGAPAGGGEIALAAAGLLATPLLAFLGHPLLAQASALAVLAVVAAFGLRRFRAAPARRMPDAFVLLPFGLLMGCAGGLLVAAATLGAPAWTMAAGKGLVQEAQFFAFILGAGHLVLPVLTGHQPPPDGEDTPAGRRARRGHVVLALALAAGVVMARVGVEDAAWLRAGLALQLVAFVADALGCMRAHRLPRVPGLHRRIAWLSFWLVPAGLLLSLAFPLQRIGAMHLTYVGGFALLSFAVGAHVIASHGGHPEIVTGRPRAAWVFGSLFLLAALTRASADFLPRSYVAHLGWSAVIWIVALAAWGWLLVPKALAVKAPNAAHELPVLQPGQGSGAPHGKSC